MSPIRLALLLCDTPIQPVVDEHGDYTRIFDKLFRDSCPPGVTYVMDSFDVRNKMEYPEDIDQYDGLVMTGSAASAYENFEWINRLVAYVASVAETKPNVKIIGICFGHQIVARALGKDCVPNNGIWEAGLVTIELTETGKQLFGGRDELNIQQMHRDHIPEIPKGCELLASTSVCKNQGFVRFTPGTTSRRPKDIQIFTVQGHPEFTEGIVSKVVDLRASTGVIDQPTAQRARERASWRNDGVSVIGKVIWQILGVEPSVKHVPLTM
ncbi:class I glutamine amidotransferase-like protein [Phanerochaete sordida]|uniref:Class I glutamine amidotransferase-like protein n=1 Tax=Phanerochaete sordida TaxID=48140 RepID=A0A9P3GNK9_9APHY|nr:class I glutamine amidotransferase-like protein [Phanerochaete sordida]